MILKTNKSKTQILPPLSHNRVQAKPATFINFPEYVSFCVIRLYAALTIIRYYAVRILVVYHLASEFFVFFLPIFDGICAPTLI